MNGTGFLTACIVAFAGVSASLAPFAERAKNQNMKKPDSGVQSEIGPFCFELAGFCSSCTRSGLFRVAAIMPLHLESSTTKREH
jgi:hypothetical protein